MENTPTPDMDIRDRILSILSENYTGLYYFNLDEKKIASYSLTERIASDTGKYLRESKNVLEVLNAFIDNLVHPDDRDSLRRAMNFSYVAERLANEKSFSLVFRRNFGGVYHYTEMIVHKAEKINEPAVHVAVGFREIDREYRAELERLEEEASRARLMNSSLEAQMSHLSQDVNFFTVAASSVYSLSVAANLTDDTCRVIMQSKDLPPIGNVCENGYEALIKHGLTSIPSEEDKREFYSRFSRASLLEHHKNGTRPHSFRHRHILNNGVEHWVETKVRFMPDDGSGNIHVITLDRIADSDVEQLDEIRKDKDEQIRRRDERLRMLDLVNELSSEYEVVYYVNADTRDYRAYYQKISDRHHDNDAITDAFERFRLNTILHVAQEDLSDTLIGFSEQNIRKKLSKEDKFTVFYKVFLNGEPVHYEAKFMRTAKESEDLRFIMAIRNIEAEAREQIRMQTALKDALALARSASEAKTKFLFNMSHDIRTPMNAIMGYTAMAKKHIDTPEKVIDCLGKIEIAGNNLLMLINQVLEMSRIETGKAVVSENEIDLIERSNVLMAVLSATADLKGITAVFEAGEIADRYVYTDESRVNQILTNIIGNAIKYTPEGGKVTFSLCQVPYSASKRGLYRFTVADTGIGMSEEFLPHVFEEFSRETSSTVSGIQGTGLGMPIVKKTVDLLGGEIKIKSKLGSGTTVTIEIPMKLSERSPEEKSEGEGETVRLDGHRILLVEDNMMNREIAEEILSDVGVIVETAEDGDVAVEKVKNSRPGWYDAVLMDVQMPRMNGYEATRAIRVLENKALASVPIIAMTANAFEEDRRNAIEAGMNEHISKPIDIQKLILSLSRIMKQGKTV
ncbi:MAG: response regulator [Firmicutes bacterium]|nr:response regulator [Candidatus Colimorpha enterica]